jgi:hypothetical protein
MKSLTANRLTDGVVEHNGGWSETVDNADIAHDKQPEARLEAIGAEAQANNEVVDVNRSKDRLFAQGAGPPA